MTNIPIISVTGTKGKTTTVAVIADVLRTLEKNVLKVDTTGHFVNGERRSTLEDSKATWRLVPTVCPGRYLWEFHSHPDLVDGGVAVLESALGSSALSGMGYRYHKVGIFLNVFEDHIGSSDRIKNKADIAKAKDFVFSRLDPEGAYAVFNADDEYVTATLHKVPDSVRKPENMIACGLTFNQFDIKGHLADGGVAVTVNDTNDVVIRSKDGDTVIANLNNIPWTFGGKFLPSVWNIISAVGALYGYFEGNVPTGMKKAIEAVRLDQYGGRLTLLKNANDVKILADYAHEKVSLKMVAELAQTLKKDGGKVIGVVRLAHDRTDELMRETGEVVGEVYDRLIVYEKIDGYWRKPKTVGTRFPQIVGRTSKIFTEGIMKTNSNVERVLREDDALKLASSIAEPGDVVVAIVNDDIERSIGFIRNIFKAEFI